MTKSKKQILTGIMSIIFHIFGVDRFLMKQKSEGFATLVKTVLLIAISSFLLKYSSLYYLTTMGIVEKVLLALKDARGRFRTSAVEDMNRIKNENAIGNFVGKYGAEQISNAIFIVFTAFANSFGL